MKTARLAISLAALTLAFNATTAVQAIPPGYKFCMLYCSDSYVVCMLRCSQLWCTDPTTPLEWRKGCPRWWWLEHWSNNGIQFRSISTGDGSNPLTETVFEGAKVPYLETKGVSTLRFEIEDAQAATNPIRSISVSLLTRRKGSLVWVDLGGTSSSRSLTDVVVEADLDGDGAPDELSGVLSFEITRADGSEPFYTVFFAGDPTLPPEPSFLRGDANGDGGVDIADAIFGLGYLFLGDAKPACMDAADTNDTGKFDLSDPISILGWAFSGSAAPPAPGPSTCGTDPTPDSLGCEAYNGCN